MSTSKSRTYLTAAETAKLVRKALKAEFAGTKFSVRSDTYAGGASIRVKWTDGPLDSEVKAVTSLYTGADMDLYQDMKVYNDSILVDENGEPRVVHFGADFIFTDRNVSDQRMALYRREVERFVGRKLRRDELIDDCHVIQHGDMAGQLCKGVGPYGRDCVDALARQIGLIRPWKGERCPGTPEVLPDVYCTGCGRYEGDHRAPHLH